MRVLLSTIGSRGEAQPVLGLAVQLKELGQEVVVCAPPDFAGLAGSLGIPYVPVGPLLHGTAKQSAATIPTPEEIRRMIEGTVAVQFEAVGQAAVNCDVIVGCGALAIAARSIAEQREVGYVYAAFAPITLPSTHHAPPVFTMLGQKPANGVVDNAKLWAEDAQRWNDHWSAALNSQRAALGLPPVTDVRGHIFTDAPWLAADATLAPWPEPSELAVFQTGAWMLHDDRPLPDELERFLDAGEAPIYFGFGSMRAPQGAAQTFVATARALGRRAILGKGWAELGVGDDEPDCLAIGEVNQQALFKRVAAVVHHGGAGTTTTAAAAGVPQIIVPQMFDQFYFARRVDQLGIGSGGVGGELTTDSLTRAVSRALAPQVVKAAKGVAERVGPDGALIAARRLIEMT